MGLEIERKFLVKSFVGLDDAKTVERIRQGYLSVTPERTVRIRMFNENVAWIAVKGKNEGAVRKEFEYRIPEDDGRELLEMCISGYIDKTRYTIPYHDLNIEVDVFSGPNLGLVIAEIEFPENHMLLGMVGKELEPYLPSWLGKEVTNESMYYNSNLLTYPYTEWEIE